MRNANHSIPTKAAASVERDRCSFKRLVNTFGGLNLREITPSKIAEHKSLRRQNGVKPGTIAKELQLLRNALNIAVREWEWIETTPFSRVKIEMPDNKKERWLSPDEEVLLLGECPEWLREIVTFAIYTGMRRNEILSLRWPQVDLERQANAPYNQEQGKAHRANQ
jgi:integrase